MPKLGFMVLVGVITLASGAASVTLALIPDLGLSPHAATLIQMFSDTWKIGVGALIGAGREFGGR
ncbi:protein of unknown function [Magnetospirillum sp. XM-1]|uniref:hypothetical protein n=1 Tax=Magnetospirillum sp. XM-1 TaxID=1663591 RepID=UPI00073DFD0C|nr:hypothetical protein [Magnetospirillum sp. XM-1]CUW40223.1 protein of unknown function [Magnetospirillum sp. XM-1]